MLRELEPRITEKAYDKEKSDLMFILFGIIKLDTNIVNLMKI